MIDYHELQREDIQQIWSIDRSEKIDAEYYFRDGALSLRSIDIDVTGWPVGEPEKRAPILEMIYDHGGWLYGAFDSQALVGVIILTASFVSTVREQLELKFLYIDQAYRKQLLGQNLFKRAVKEAARRDAKGLYISASPTKRTIDFYMRMGCSPVVKPDAKLYELEPDDIHLEYCIKNAIDELTMPAV